MADVALPGSRKFNGRCSIRTCDLLLVSIAGGRTYHGENSTKSTWTARSAVLASRRHLIPGYGNGWQAATNGGHSVARGGTEACCSWHPAPCVSRWMVRDWWNRAVHSGDD